MEIVLKNGEKIILKKLLKEDFNKSGIYFLKCKKNNYGYLGYASNFRKRKAIHKYKLKNKISNSLLQKDFNYYGWSEFDFLIIEFCDKSILEEREKYYLDKFLIDNLYNFTLSNSKSYLHHEETKNKIKKANIGNTNNRVLTLEQFLEIKELLLEETAELWKDKYFRISKIYNVSRRTIQKIKIGEYVYSNNMGKYIDWIKEREDK